MCQILEFQKILDSNYTRTGLLIYVKFPQTIGHLPKNYSK